MMMNDNENNDINKSSTNPPSQNSSKEKDPPSELAKNENKRKDDKVKFDHNQDFSGSIKFTKPGAVPVQEGDESKIKQKKEIIMKYNAPIDRVKLLPGHYPINEEPGSNNKKDVLEKKVEKEKDMSASKGTLLGATAVKFGSRSQLIERKAAIESRSNFSSGNTKNHGKRLKTKTEEDNRLRYLPSNETSAQTNATFANDEERHPGFSTSLIEECVALEQDRGIVNEANYHNELPIATTLNDSEVLPRAEPIDLVEDIVVVDAKVIIHVSMQMNDYLFLNVVNIIHK